MRNWHGLRSPFGSWHSGDRGFNPRTLFGPTDTGWFYDLSDMSTLFQEAAGTTPVTAVGQPVGLSLDKSKGLVLGPELVTNGDFSSGTTGWTLQTGWTIAGGVASFSGGSGVALLQDTGLAAGKTYEITLTVVAISSGAFRVLCGFDTASPNITSAGTYTFRLLRGTNAFIYVQSQGATVGSIDNISVRELPGNHRSQSASLPRPTYARHPLGGIRNLLTFTEEFDNPAWVKNQTTVVSSVDVPSQGPTTAFLLRPTTNNAGNHHLTQALSAAGTVTQSVYAKASGYNFFGVTFDNSAAKSVRFNLSTGSVATAGASATGSIVSVGNGWYRISVTTTLGASSVVWYPLPTNAYTTFAGDGTSGTIIAGAQLELGSTATAYQRVVSVFDVTEAGQPDLYYLSYDGLNDSLSTAPFAWGSDKATVVAGVRKLSDAARGTLLQFGLIGTNAGSFNLLAPQSAAGAGNYQFASSGTIADFAGGFTGTGSLYPAPITNVLTGISNISGPSLSLRINGVVAASGTATQGAGNFGTFPAIFGARASSSDYFNGREYSNFAINRLLTPNELSQIERYTAQRTGVIL